jgi:hypothetical protein
LLQPSIHSNVPHPFSTRHTSLHHPPITVHFKG